MGNSSNRGMDSGKDIELKRLPVVYNQEIIQEEIYWKEKLGDKWIIEGDRNMEFGHAKVKSRWNKQVKKLLLGEDEEEWTEDIGESTTQQIYSLQSN